MKVKESMIVGIAGIIFGICNIIPAFGETKWTLLAYFIVLGVPEIITGIGAFKIKEAKQLRSVSWVNAIVGLAILALNISEYYHSATMAGLNYIAAAGLIISGIYGIYKCKTKYNLELVP
ncbi:hypothetical protein NSA47_14475 [Irregularibacter muris]|uniref:Uncharacterized protein n=1 Tax=Irregularibacter muris TaxID=1796619 RepID=A0AAE3HJZ0_9FIRM|nr:hypothetical protein [Irregularibacter muris]MCR1900169.1 hypothetical protein [Irregularibacter muris]